MTSAAGAPLRLIDHSAGARVGAKGAGAAAWLQDGGVPLPARPLQWRAFDRGLVLRLGLTEVLVEADDATCACLAARPRGERMVKVLHQSLAVELRGAATDALLRQVCNIPFGSLDGAAQPVVLTSLAGVGVTVLPTYDDDGLAAVRLWADGTYGRYLWRTLAALTREFGGDCDGEPACAV